MDTHPLISTSPITYKDRRTGLIVFGVFEIILGAFCLLMLPLMIFGQIMAAKKAGHEFDFALVAPSLLIFLLLAGALIWLGIGSIQARRWARALLLCLGWMGLCLGLFSMAIVIPTLGSMDETLRQQGQAVSASALAFAKIFAITLITIIYILIPGAIVLFYRSSHVRLTCENRDPVKRWTDRCPLPVLAMIILQLFGAVCLIGMPRFGAAMPLAGFLVTGWLARLLWLGFAGLSFYAAWGFYHLNARAWLIYTIAIVAIGISSTATFLRVDLLDYYRAVGMPAWQISQLAASPLIRSNALIWISASSIVLVGGYLLFLRRYFVAAKVARPATE